MDENQIILAVHIPKTGGTTFKNILRNIYGKQFIRVRKKSGYVQQVSDDTKLSVEQHTHKKGACVIYGHFYLDPFYAEYPHAKLAVWLRDPVQRILSNYFFSMRCDVVEPHAATPLLDEQQLLNYISDEKNQNLMSKMIGNHKIQDFDYVGITEEFQKSLDLFTAVFETRKIKVHKNKFVVNVLNLLKTGSVHVRQRKMNPHRTSCEYAIDDNLRHKILELNAEDSALYRAGKEHFDKLCRQWLSSVSTPLTSILTLWQTVSSIS